MSARGAAPQTAPPAGSASLRLWLLAASVVVAPVAVTVAVLVFIGYDIAGMPPFSYGPPQNVAEAAAMGNAAEVLRFLPTVTDPNQLLPIRRDLISSTITRVTVLEAAVWSRRAQLIALLDSRGVLRDPPTRAHITCLARDLPVDEIVEYLDRDRVVTCQSGEAMERVLARSPAP